MKLRSLHRGAVGIDFLDYGAEVRIDPEGLENFWLVQVPLAGRARMQVGSNIVESNPRVAVHPSDGPPVFDGLGSRRSTFDRLCESPRACRRS